MPPSHWLSLLFQISAENVSFFPSLCLLMFLSPYVIFKNSVMYYLILVKCFREGTKQTDSMLSIADDACNEPTYPYYQLLHYKGIQICRHSLFRVGVGDRVNRVLWNRPSPHSNGGGGQEGLKCAK